jgi:hypothetical protein
MKKGFILVLTLAGISAAMLTACGEKFVPLTQEQVNAKVDSVFNAQKEAKLNELNAACESSLEAQVNAKVESLKGAETASK